MPEKILIVEDELIVATDLRLQLEKAGFYVTGIAGSYYKAMECIATLKPDFVIVDIFLKGSLTGIDLARKLRDENIGFIFLSANATEEILAMAKTTNPDGFIVKPYRLKDLLVTLDIASYRHRHQTELNTKKEKQFLNQWQQVCNDQSDRKEKLNKFFRILQSFIPFDFGCIDYKLKSSEFANPLLNLLRIGFDEYQEIGKNEWQVISKLDHEALTTLQSSTTLYPVPMMLDEKAYEKVCETDEMKKLIADIFHIKTSLTLPFKLSNETAFQIQFFSRRAVAFHPDHIAVFFRLKEGIQSGFETLMNAEEFLVSNGTDRRNKVADTAAKEIFKEIIGNSHHMLNVFDQVMQVAPADTSVLLLGESGTGKGKIASCIQQLSGRNNQPFIYINCSILPTTMIESELFGHEKGAFTGAQEKRIGRFAQADKGTVFLDEIGELALDMQVKLLHVLQEKEIEPVGARKPIKVNVRVIAATNRNLEKEVAEGRFRLDLYYRLNVFPIEIPALRDRKEDIHLLAEHFLTLANYKCRKSVSAISPKAIKLMEGYSWPGNIRELENVIERCVLMAKGNLIDETLLPAFLQKQVVSQETNKLKTIYENEKDHIITILKKCNGRIWGPGGAAEILNIPPTTLNSKMKKLGIQKQA